MKDKVRRKVTKKDNSVKVIKVILILLLICFIAIFVNKVVKEHKEVDVYNQKVDIYSQEVDIYNQEEIIKVNNNISENEKNNDVKENPLNEEKKSEEKIKEEEKAKENIKPQVKPTNNVKPNNVKPKENIKPTYIKGILIANKTYKLPSTYNPGLQKNAKEAFDKMKIDAKKDGITLWILSGFRSYKTQENLYNRYVRTYGKKVSDTFSARPRSF